MCESIHLCYIQFSFPHFLPTFVISFLYISTVFYISSFTICSIIIILSYIDILLTTNSLAVVFYLFSVEVHNLAEFLIIAILS